MPSLRQSRASSPSGAYVSQQELMQLRHGAQGLRGVSKRRSSHQLQGASQSRLRGRGLDFAEVRPYQAGDDVRTIDWRVTARSDQPHTRLYTEERERPVLIMCDQRSTMFFGTQVRFKSVQAAVIGATIAWAAHARGDRVGGLVLGDSDYAEIRPQSRSKSVLQLLHQLATYNNVLQHNQTDPQTRLSDALADIRRTARPGTAVFLISDFGDIDQDCERQLFLISRHCDVHAFWLTDTLEQMLPGAGVFHLQHGSATLALDGRSQKRRQLITAAFAQRKQVLEQTLQRLQIPLSEVSTSDEAQPLLQQYLGKRAGGN